ncbi:large ribosomal subunit protein mL46 [Onthophagus taurus]|uniref:large ribosomal subunit protein mL46 n=1 Tax=Onthophagus taurus TaxID=166361 RepID=UPI000C2019F6|nr:39S ribosomal protein L46, mitochondrial [Onthophagus taurus]
MLRNSFQVFRLTKTSIRESSTLTSQKWDLISAVCIERRPTLAPPSTGLQENFKKYLDKVELERSHKSNHEIRHEQDLIQAEQLKKGDGDVDMALKQTAQDFFDASREELKRFKVAEKITECDKKNNVKSLNRKLDKHLVFVMKQKIGNKDHYLLPQGLRKDGENMRQAADRVIKETFGGDFKVQIHGNAPCGVYKYKYPGNLKEKQSCVGAKIFFYFGRYTNGNINKQISDYKWLDRNELKNELHNGYYERLSQFLIDEN